MSSNSEKGKKFEEEVEILLRLKGFNVSRNHLVNGTQIDLIASKDDLLENIHFVVECTDRNTPLGVDVVKEKSAILLTLSQAKQPFRLLFVTRNGYTAEAKEFAANSTKIVLVTSIELENSIINFHNYVLWYRNNYEASLGFFKEGDLFNNYVDLLAKNEEGSVLNSLNVEVRKWLKDKSNNLLFLLGEFGSGKTSFCRSFVYEMLMDKYIRKTGENYTPILINLREYQQASNIQQVITDTLLNQYGIPINSFMAFEKVCMSGNVLLVLDGFDEMADRSDKKTITDCFNQIYLLASLNAKVLLTCRSNFFQNHSDIISLLKRFSFNLALENPNEQGFVEISFENQGRILFVEHLSPEKIRQFIENRFPNESLHIINQIDSIHDLGDLSKRPVLLDMILRTLPELSKQKKKINSASLYEAYTNKWTARDEWRVSIPLTIRKRFCDVFAWFVHNLPHHGVPYSVLEMSISSALDGIAQSDEQFEKFKNDLQTCSFLVRSGDSDVFRFAHKSFLEYFIARKIVTNLLNDEVPEKPDTERFEAVNEKKWSTKFNWDRDFMFKVLSTHLHGTAFNWIRSSLADRIRYSTSKLNIPTWESWTSQANLKSNIESNIKEIFVKAGFIKSEYKIGLSEEIATFSLEYLANNQPSFSDLIKTIKSNETIEVFADILRLSKRSDFIVSNLEFIKSFIKKTDNQRLKTALCVALSKNPKTIDLQFVKEICQHLSPQEWSFFLFELSLNIKDYSSLITECYNLPNNRLIDKLICVHANWDTFSKTQIENEVASLLKSIIRTSDSDERSLVLNLLESKAFPIKIILDLIIEFLKSEQDKYVADLVVEFIGSLNIGNHWKTFRTLALQEKNPELKKRLQKIEKIARDTFSIQKNSSTFQNKIDNHVVRDKLWKSLGK